MYIVTFKEFDVEESILSYWTLEAFLILCIVESLLEFCLSSSYLVRFLDVLEEG